MMKNEFEFKKWFENNYTKLGYNKIIRKDNGTFPDFIMMKDGKRIRVELETMSSNFKLHKHPINKVDEIVCIKKDVDLDVHTIEVSELDFQPIQRICVTLDESTIEILKKLVKDGKYRSLSHAAEELIKGNAHE